MSKAPIRIAITGAAGQIGYALVFRIASGELFGKDQPVILHLLEATPSLRVLQGLSMELEDSAFPMLAGIVQTDDPNVAFKDVNIAILLGAKAGNKGADRKDMLAANAAIFKAHGAALNAHAARNVKVLVVGNPTNTNTLAAMQAAPNLPAENFSAMLRLDHNRALAKLAAHTNRPVGSIKHLILWGHHGSGLCADLRFATIMGQPALKLVGDPTWYQDDYLPAISKRNDALIETRGLSAAASAASAIIAQLQDWLLGTQGEWVTMGVRSNGEYDIPAGLIYGFPVTIENGRWQIVPNLEIDTLTREKMQRSAQELAEERDTIKHLLV